MVETKLTVEEAKALCAELRRDVISYWGGFVTKLRAKIEVKDAYDKDPRVVFYGAKTGEHSLWLSVSSKERILAHWEGYCEANHCLRPEVGAKVEVPSASHPLGYRRARVTKVGPKRATCSFTYKHGGAGEKTVPFAELRMVVS